MLFHTACFYDLTLSKIKVMKKFNFVFNLKSLFTLVFNRKKSVSDSYSDNTPYSPPFSDEGNHFLGGWFGESI